LDASIVLMQTRSRETTTPKDRQMQKAGYSGGPRWAAIRDEFREKRAARAARKSLERELASYTSPRDLDDLEAILQRYSEEETADIRRILAGRRAA
jgi:hypothetical protein